MRASSYMSAVDSVALVNDDYCTDNCRCRIHDVACLGWYVKVCDRVCNVSLTFANTPTSGNVVGYHVTQPCESCLESCNNGHFWMFQTEGVVSSERLDPSGMFVSDVNDAMQTSANV